MPASRTRITTAFHLSGGEYPEGSLEALFVEELARLQPTAGDMGMLKDSVLGVWHDRKAWVKNEVASAEGRARMRFNRSLIASMTLHLQGVDRPPHL